VILVVTPAEHIIEIDSKSAMTSLHSSVMEETGRLGVDIFIDNGGISSTILGFLVASYFTENSLIYHYNTRGKK